MSTWQNENQKRSGTWKTLGGLSLILALAGKLKGLLPLLKLGKVGGTVWSLLLSIGAYALVAPWSFAIGLVAMLLIHELGHVWAAKRRQLPVSAPMFIPFVGALITMRKIPDNAETEAYVALGGPLLGTVGATAAFLLGWATGSHAFYVAASIGLFLNLINLLPIHPLDGGRIVTVISRWLWFLGLIGGFFLIVFVLHSILFLIIWLMFAWNLAQAYLFRRKNKTVTLEQTVRFAETELDAAGVFLPGEAHQRQLPFSAYCRRDDKALVVEARLYDWPITLSFPQARGAVHAVTLVRTRRFPLDAGGGAELTFHVTYEPDPSEQNGGIVRDEAYYRVPPRVRLRYALAYFGLAAYLAGMLLVTHRAMVPLTA
ncbi:MAG TPA: site-2 protease family protein [Calditerricola sp.]